MFVDIDIEPDVQVLSVSGDKFPVQLKNITNNSWIVETSSGKLKSVEPNQFMPVKVGLKINLGGTIKGEII